MHDSAVEDGVKSLSDLFRAADPLQTRAVFHYMRLLLNSGQAVSVDSLAESLQLPLEQAQSVTREIRARGGEFDSEGNFIGFGLTLVPTPHRYHAQDRDFFVWCATDALIFPVIFGHSAVIRSPDPVTGEAIHLSVTADAVESVTPKTAVVSQAMETLDVDNVRGSMCSYGHFFGSADSAKQYIGNHEGAGLQVVPVSKGFRIGRILVRRDPSVKAILSQIVADA